MIWIIAKRELAVRGRSKGFLVVTAIMFVAVFGVAIVMSLIRGGNEPREVAIGLQSEAAPLVDALSVGNDDVAPTVRVVGRGTAELEAETIDVLFDGSTLTWRASPDVQLDDYIRSTVQQRAFVDRADGLGLDAGDVQTLFEPVEIAEVRLDGGKEEYGVRLAAAAAAGFANFILIQVWGAFMMMGVTEEKSSKVIEILLSHVRPTILLAGKVLGLGLLALGQLLIFVSGLVVGLALVRNIDVPGDVWGTIPLLLPTFLLGFGFYATAFAAVGSMVSRQEDAQTAQLPAVLPLVAGYVIASASLAQPENLAVTIGSFVPFTSPVLLPFRTALTDVPLWQVVLSLLILAASIVVMLQLAGRIYRYSLLRTGSRVTWGEAWRNRNQEPLSSSSLD
ncbi:MAG: ABC transporter permease [Acidimicrobiales bacterium]